MEPAASPLMLLPVLVVESDQVVRRALGAMFFHAFGTQTVTVTNVAEARAELASREFGFVAVDAQALVLVAEVTARYPQCRVMVVAATLDEATVRDALCAGAAAVVSRHLDPRCLIDRVRLLSSGGVFLDESARAALVDLTAAPAVPALSERELEVLAQIETGADLRTVARRLDLSVSTVKSHAAKASAKLGCGSSHRAALQARRLGLLDGVVAPLAGVR